MRHCVVSVPPLLNQAVIFTTDETSYHGFPEKFACPEGVSRRSLAFYYYTVEQEGACAARSTDYQARPADGRGKASLIWLVKKAVDFYSPLKAVPGLSDDFASRALGFMSRKK